MPHFLLVETTLVPSPGQQKPDYTFKDGKDGVHFLKRIHDEGQTVIFNSRISDGQPAGTQFYKEVSEVTAQQPTSIHVENPGAITFENLQEFLNDSTTLFAFNLDSYFHQGNVMKYDQLIALVTLALEKNPNLQHINLMACPLSPSLFKILMTAAQEGRLKSCVLSNHDKPPFNKEIAQLQKIIKSVQESKSHHASLLGRFAASLAKGLGFKGGDDMKDGEQAQAAPVAPKQQRQALS